MGQRSRTAGQCDERAASFQGLSGARTGTGRFVDDRARRPRQRHGDVVAIEFEPPQVACVVSGNDYSFAALRSTGECVIAVPARKLVRKVVDVGNSSGRDIDKFETFGLTKLPASCVAPPLIADCFANLECKVTDMRLVNKYNLFILEVLKAWIDPAQKNPKTIHHRGYGTFAVDGEIIKLKSRMR